MNKFKERKNPPDKEQYEAYQKIANALFNSIPNEWIECLVNISVNNPDKPVITITGHNNSPLLKIPYKDLYSAVYNLIDLFKNYSGKVFKSAIYKLIWDENDESWRFAMNYKWD